MALSVETILLKDLLILSEGRFHMRRRRIAFFSFTVTIKYTD